MDESKLIEELNELTDQQRIELFELLRDRFCIYCGRQMITNRCQCWNDD